MLKVPAMYNGGFFPDIFTVDPRLLPSGNPFKCHDVEALSLQPTKQHIITTLFDDVPVLHCSVLFLLFVWCSCMAIDVGVQYI